MNLVSGGLAGLVGALLFTGLFGLARRIAGLDTGWEWALPLLMSGFASGLGVWLVVDQWLGVRERTVQARLNEAKAWSDELRNQAQELLIQAAQLTPNAQPEQARHDQMTEKIELFFRDGDAHGFTIDAMKGAVGSTTWARLTDFYCSDAGNRVLRNAGGKIGTQWGWGWGLEDVLRSLALGVFPLPPGDVPEVVWRPRDATQRNTERKRKTQGGKGSDEPGPVAKGVVSGERA